MKKIFTLIVILGITVSAMAQQHGAMNFVGTSTFYVVGMQEATTTQVENDKVVLTLTGEGSKLADIKIPDMNYNMQGTIMELKSFTANSGVEYTMTGSFKTGDMAFDWAEGDFTTTTTGADGQTKTVAGKISANYGHNSKKLKVTAEFKYGGMPFPIHYEIEGDYQKETGIEGVSENVSEKKSDAAFNLAGQCVGAGAKGIVIIGGKKYLR
ncbi:MAG: hypothetical protein J5914_03140 [Prevotella sp.]|nr:hypothetical protein [Prevotella sp.]